TSLRPLSGTVMSRQVDRAPCRFAPITAVARARAADILSGSAGCSVTTVAASSLDHEPRAFHASLPHDRRGCSPARRRLLFVAADRPAGRSAGGPRGG